MKQSRLKQSVIRSGVVALGLLVLAVLALEVDLSFLHVVGEQKRAYVLLATGLVCLFGSGVGMFVAGSKAEADGAPARACPWGHCPPDAFFPLRSIPEHPS